MRDGTGQLLISLVAVFFGGGAVQLIVAVFRRRSELGEIDARTESMTANIADQLAARLAGENARLETRATKLETNIETLRSGLDATRTENARLILEIVALRTDLALVRAEILDLRSRGAR